MKAPHFFRNFSTPFFVFLLTPLFQFGLGQSITSVDYNFDTNILSLSFDNTIQTNSLDLSKLHLSDGEATVTLSKAVNLTAPDNQSQVDIGMLYGSIIDSTIGQYYSDNRYQFRFWGTNTSLLEAVESLNTGNLILQVDAGAFEDLSGNANTADELSCSVTSSTSAPQLLSTAYRARENELTLIFDQLVQFDRVAEDRAINFGPGNGVLEPPVPGQDAGEDRNANGVLDMERNIRHEQITFVDGNGNTMTLEGITNSLATVDSDAMTLTLTPFDAMRLETWLDPMNNLEIHLLPWAFSNVAYNQNAETIAAVDFTPDPVSFVPDSVVYNVSKNDLSLFFSDLAADGRNLDIENTAPVYGNFHFSNGSSDYALTGVQGSPSLIDGPGVMFKLQIHDQNQVEAMLEAGDFTLTIEGHTVYDNLGNGNQQAGDIPIQVTSTTSMSEQPPNLTEAIFNPESHLLTLRWDLSLGVGYYLEQPLQAGTPESPPDTWQDLAGFMLYDAETGSTESFGSGAAFYNGPRSQTYFKLTPQATHRLQTHPHPDALFITVEPRIFNAFLYLNGNAATTIEDGIALTLLADNTAPFATDVRFDLLNHIITVSVDEAVELTEIQATDFSVNSIGLDGTITFNGMNGYGEQFSIQLTDAVFNALMAQSPEQVINPQLTIPAGLLRNAAGLESDVQIMTMRTGRPFYVRSFEAFPVDPELQFGELKRIGAEIDIYVAGNMWESRITQPDLEAITSAFETQAPNDPNRGIQAIVDEYYGGIYDTDGNGKVILFLTDIADEFDQGRNDTDADFFTDGYVTPVDTTDADPHSNQGDIIYLDVDPQMVGTAPYTAWNHAIFNALTYQYALLSAMEKSPNQEKWIQYGVALKLQEKAVGNVKFFGDGTNTRVTSANGLTHINTSLLKSRNDLFNVYNFFTYLTEKYSDPSAPLAVIEAIATSDESGIAAIDEAIAQFDESATTAQALSSYATACFLDMVQNDPNTTAVDSLYGGLYNFEAFEFTEPPVMKNSENIPWDATHNAGAPYHNTMSPWSFEYKIFRAYYQSLDGDIVVVSPDLSPDDTLFFAGIPQQDFKIKKVMLRSGFLNPMTDNFEVVDVPYDAETGLGTIPVTTDSNFVFGDTLPDPNNGVQILVLVFSKTNDLENTPTQVDMSFSNQPLNGLAPGHIQAVATTTGMNLQWSAPSPLGDFTPESYNIFRLAEDETEIMLLASEYAGTTFLDESPDPGVSYRYGVQAIFTNGSVSDTVFTPLSIRFGSGAIGMRTAITNYGSIGDPNFQSTGRPSFEFPAFSGNNYLYDGGLWVGTLLGGEPAVTTYFYNPDQEWAPGHEYGGEPRPQKTFFVPENPDAPVVTYFDDLEPRSESNHVPLGIKVIETFEPGGTVIDPDTDEEILAPWAKVTYKLFNTGLNSDLQDVYVSLWMDFDVASIDPGNLAIDDLVDYNPDLMLSYMYDWDDPVSEENDIGEFGLATGYVGTALLKSPTETISAHAWWNWENDPKNDAQRFDFMTGNSPYMMGYQYLPNPWDLGYPAFDYRTLQTTGPFDIVRYDTVTVQFLLVAGDGYEDLMSNAQLARDLYYTDIAEEGDGVTPATFTLDQNYPNPFNAATTIRYSLPEASRVRITIFNILGQQVSVLRDTQQPAGRYQLTWNPQQAASGLYFIRLEAGDYSKTVKSLLLK